MKQILPYVYVVLSAILFIMYINLSLVPISNSYCLAGIPISSFIYLYYT